MFRKSLLFALMGALAFGTSCLELQQALGIASQEEGNDLELAAALVALSNDSSSSSCDCELGNACFTIASGSLTCSGGSVSGSGTLSASSGDFVSLSLDIQLTSGGGTVTFNTGAASDANTKQSGIVVRDTTAHQWFGNGSGDTNLAGTASLASTSSATSFCLESHLTEGHVLVRSGGCPTSSTAVTAAAAGSTDEDESFNADSGRIWSLILSNATISNVNINSSEQFSG